MEEDFVSKCFFIGHRECPQELYPQLMAAIKGCITNDNVCEFIVGNYGKFDRMAARCVIEAKQSYPFIVLTMLLPYHPSEREMVLPEGFDASLYPEGQETVPKRVAIVRANQYAVNQVDYLIAYV